jgi:hypothetical protein
MARTLFRLTERIVRKLAVPGYHADGGGLYLQISKVGGRSWVYRFSLHKRTRDMGLGPVRFVSFAEARTKASECRALVAKGIDPIDLARAQQSTLAVPAKNRRKADAPTFKEFAERYIEQRATSWRSDKHARQWQRTLAEYAYPVVGELTLDEIDTPDILRILEPIWQTKSETASRVSHKQQDP